jgi:hypothetical protein
MNGSPRDAVVRPLVAEPGRLLSLLEIMQRFHPEILVQNMGVLETLSMSYLPSPQEPVQGDKMLKCQFILDNIENECATVGLKCSLVTLRKLRLFSKLPTFTYQQLRDLLEELIGRVRDEISEVVFMTLDSKDADLWEKPELFGAPVNEKFPSAIYDIEEAGKCLACGRGTAAVFHLMRVMEIGLKATAAALEISYAPSWDGYLRQLKANLEKDWKEKSPDWKQEEPFFREVYGHLHAVKIAWRNPTMHVQKVHTAEQAEDIFYAVRGFMRHLAERLSEEK